MHHCGVLLAVRIAVYSLCLVQSVIGAGMLPGMMVCIGTLSSAGIMGALWRALRGQRR
jgi:hypothetical protein